MQTYKFAKLIATGITSFVLGLCLIVTGELQSIIAGAGAILAAVVLFSYLGWAFASNKTETANADADQQSKSETRMRLVWLGIGLTLAPGLVYFYFRFTMSHFDPKAAIFLSVPLLVAGIGLIAVGLFSADKQ